MQSVLSVLSVLSTLIATTTAQCSSAWMEGTDYALDVCIGDNSFGKKITCTVNDTLHAEFALYEYDNFTCTGTPNTTIITSPESVGIDFYSCTGSVTGCDYSLPLIYMAINGTECGDSSISPFAMKMPMWNGYCDNGTIFSVTNCDDSLFQMTIMQFNDSYCMTDPILYNYTQSIPFVMDGAYHCMELTSENICTVDNHSYTYTTPYPTSFTTSFDTTISDNTIPPLECDHVQFDACFLGMCVSMIQAAGICTTEVEYDGFRNLETKHEKAVCENGIYYLRQYKNDDCSGPYTESVNYVEMLEIYLTMSNVTSSTDEINIPVVCDTNTICPYVKIREWEDSSVTDCSTIPKDNEEYSDDIFVLNECTSMEIVDGTSGLDGTYGLKYECENNILTRSIWTNGNCNGHAMQSQQTLVGEYLECEINDKKEVVLECYNGFTQDQTVNPTKRPTIKPTGDTSQFELSGILLFSVFVCFFV